MRARYKRLLALKLQMESERSMDSVIEAVSALMDEKMAYLQSLADYGEDAEIEAAKRS